MSLRQLRDVYACQCLSMHSSSVTYIALLVTSRAKRFDVLLRRRTVGFLTIVGFLVCVCVCVCAVLVTDTAVHTKPSDGLQRELTLTPTLTECVHTLAK